VPPERSNLVLTTNILWLGNDRKEVRGRREKEGEDMNRKFCQSLTEVMRGVKDSIIIPLMEKLHP
jgi:hypothetical protein